MILLNGIKVREWIIPIIKKEIEASQVVFKGQKSCWTIFIIQTFEPPYRNMEVRIKEIFTGFLPDVKRICFGWNEELRKHLSVLGVDCQDSHIMVQRKVSTSWNFG